MKVKKLARSLRKLHEGEISEDKALGLIENATPREISKAEQMLLDEGLPESQLKDFCKIHLKAVEDKVDRIKSRLDVDHPLHILISEHDRILGFLDELESLGESAKSNGFDSEKKERLKELAEDFVEAEKHHEREEEVVFPRLEERGIDGPPRIMREDHDEFKPKKKRLLKLSEDPEGNKEEIFELIDFLTFNLRDHIFKENNILYPAALDELEDWNVMSKEGEKVGYCAFYTPELSK